MNTPKPAQVIHSIPQRPSSTELQGYTRLMRIEVESEIQSAKATAVGRVGRSAMQQAALVSLLEQNLAQSVPMASARLAAIGDLAALAMGEVVTDTSAAVRRI